MAMESIYASARYGGLVQEGVEESRVWVYTAIPGGRVGSAVGRTGAGYRGCSVGLWDLWPWQSCTETPSRSLLDHHA